MSTNHTLAIPIKPELLNKLTELAQEQKKTMEVIVVEQLEEAFLSETMTLESLLEGFDESTMHN